MAESIIEKNSRSSWNTLAPKVLEQTVDTITATPPDTNEAPEEPVTEEILLWRALMKETESREGRVSRPLRPETITSDGEMSWQAMLPLRNEKVIPTGSYWLVFCVSWKDLNFDTLESIEFDARTGGMNGQTYLMDHLVKTILSKEDLQDI
ncbi:hypothetical protein BGZ68_002375, partial [Mortierella alpina]